MISTFELSDHIVGLIIDKDMKKGNLEAIHKIILEKIEEFGTINLFLELAKGNDVTFECLWNELKFKYNNSENINKCAVVTELSWLRTTMDLNDFIVHTDIRTFELKDRMEAINWISQ